ncbi:MAG: glutathione S-transferase family protein [Caulobacterales bacterium]
MLTLWGRPSSINVQKVLWTLGELGLEHQWIDAGGEAGGLDAPAFLAMNPNGRIPVIEDGGAHVWESNAIVRYLCARYGEGGLWPADPLARAQGDQWMDWTLSTLQPAIMGLFWGFYRTPRAQRNERRNAALIADCAAAITLLDRHLAARPFVTDHGFSMADIPAGTLMYRYFALEIDRPAAPAVEAWRGRLEARGAYQAHVMAPFGELFGRLAY